MLEIKFEQFWQVYNQQFESKIQALTAYSHGWLDCEDCPTKECERCNRLDYTDNMTKTTEGDHICGYCQSEL